MLKHRFPEMADNSLIDGIEAKIARLMERHDRLLRETAELTAQRDRLKAQNRELMTKLGEADRRIATLELSEGFGGSASDRKSAKARVNRLMREIDKCIALLNK